MLAWLGQAIWVDGNLCVVWRGSEAGALWRDTGGLIIACLFFLCIPLIFLYWRNYGIFKIKNIASV